MDQQSHQIPALKVRKPPCPVIPGVIARQPVEGPLPRGTLTSPAGVRHVGTEDVLRPLADVPVDSHALIREPPRTLE